MFSLVIWLYGYMVIWLFDDIDELMLLHRILCSLMIAINSNNNSDALRSASLLLTFNYNTSLQGSMVFFIISLPRDFDAFYNHFNNGIFIKSFHFLFRIKDYTMTHYIWQNDFDIIRNNKITSLNCRKSFGCTQSGD